jgi:dolichol-phosphate mannosyltransferase
MNNEPTVSFIVLALNEERHIEATIGTVVSAVGSSRVTEYEMVLVNDGSTDRTGPLMDEAARQNPRLRVVHNKHNLGFGGAYKRGVAAARGEYVMIVAGDNAMPVTSITTILNHLGEADIIFPYVTDAKDRPLVRRVGSRGFTTVINKLFGLRLRYYNSMVPRRELLNKITIKTDGYASQAEGSIKMIRAGASYIEVGVVHGHASGGGSSAVRPKNLLKVFKAVLALIRELRRPRAVAAPARVESPAPAEKR